MAKKKKAAPSPIDTLSEPLKNANPEDMRKILNGLSEVIMGFNSNHRGAQLSQTDTIFRNLRFYLISNMRQPLSQAYAELGLVQTVVDIPVDDAFRGGVEIKSKQLSPEQIEELQIEMEQEDDLGRMVEASKWNRLYGGAGVVVITDQDPKTPLDLELISENDTIEFRAADMWELFWDKQNMEGFSASLQEQQFEFYSYYGTQVHKSRVMKLKGITAPSFIRPRLRGWGLSVVETLIRSINQYLKACDLSFEVLDEFKIDIFKIKNLTESLQSAEGQAAVMHRLQLANQQKNYQSSLAMDSEDDYMSKELSFAGLAETMEQIRMQVAADMRMPMSKLFGIPSTGFSSGEDDIEVYNAMVESQVRQKAKFSVIRMIEIRCQQVFGFVPDDLTIEFKPLRIMSSEQEENVKTNKFNRLLSAVQANLISSKTFADACNKDKLLGIQVDATDATLMDEAAAGEIAAGDEGANQSPDQKSELNPKKAPKPVTQAPVAKNSWPNIAIQDPLPLMPNADDRKLENPGDVDEAKWEAAKKACMKEYGHIKYAVVMSIYKKMMGE